MIKKVESLPLFPVSSISLAKIYAQDKAFSGSVLENDFWVQYDENRCTAIISNDNGSINVWCENSNYDELKQFLFALSPSVIFTEEKNAKPLGLKVQRIRNVLTRKVSGSSVASNDFSLAELYNGLSKGSDVDIHLPSFEVFAADVSHRLRHGGANAVLSEYGAALAFLFDGGGVMSGIAVKKEFRGKGLGKQLLNNLLNTIYGDFFVAANEENTKFYIRNDFTLIDRVVFGKME